MSGLNRSTYGVVGCLLICSRCDLCHRLRLLKKLIEDCPYHNVVGLLIDRAQREIQKLWGSTGELPTAVFTEVYMVKKITKSMQALSGDSFDDIATEMDLHTAVMALLRFLLLRDTVMCCTTSLTWLRARSP